MKHHTLMDIYRFIVHPIITFFFFTMAGLWLAVAYHLSEENKRLKNKIRNFYGEIDDKQPIEKRFSFNRIKNKFKIFNSWWKELVTNFYQMFI